MSYICAMKPTVVLFVSAAWSFGLITLADSQEQIPLWNRDYTMPKSVRLKDGDTFEYIVVGAGAAGSAVAARLALAGKDVLLVEAGGDPGPISAIPGAAPALLGSPLDYQYETISNNMSCLSYKNKQCSFSRGKCLGGSTSTNYMMYVRGNPRDFDDLGIPGWTWNDMKPYFLRYEGLKDLSELPASSIPYHNTKGEMKLEFFSEFKNPWHSRVIEGFKSLNFPVNYDVNAESQIGVSKVIGYVYKNERMSTARGYLSRNDVKKRLKVATHTQCTGVIFGDNNVAQGITVVAKNNLFKKKLKLYATKEVILSAGAIITPQILMLSGIGHAEHLNKFNIPVLADLPVGDNMTDHLLPLVFVKVDKGDNISEELTEARNKAKDLADLLFQRDGSLTSNGLTDITSFLNSNCYDFEKRQLRNDKPDCELPTLQYIHAYVDRYLVWLSGPFFRKGTGLNEAVSKQLAAISKDYAFITFSPQILQPFSQGTVRLASTDPLAPPAINPNYLSDDRDTEEMVRSILIIEDLMETPSFRQRDASIVILKLPGCPDYASDRLGYWRCYCRHMTHTSFHALGTTGLGRVLDPELRVLSTDRLRVADLGAMPQLPRGNTAATAIAIGEKLADLILNDDDSDDWSSL